MHVGPNPQERHHTQREHAQALFDHFPLPLVILDENGAVQFANERYLARFGTGAPMPVSLRYLADKTDGAWHSLGIAAADRRTTDVRVQVLRAGRSTVLIVDDTPPPPPGTLDELRARVSELEQLSAVDHLTGAWNRSHFDRIVAAELARSLRHRQPLSMLLVDIDHFKRINDDHGHLAGDEVLKQLVELCRRKLRATDILFRWGGEEFAILAVASGHRHAHVLAERLRQAIKRHVFAVGAMTVSIGVAESAADETLLQWFERLDRLLYAAKVAGRDRVMTEECGNSDVWAGSGTQALRFVWQEAFECGHPVIDKEHIGLFARANSLLELVSAVDTDPAAVSVAMDNLIDHVVSHFSHEEAILSAYGYEQLAGHRRLHAQLVSSFRALQVTAGLDIGAMGRAIEYLARDVITGHLFGADRDFFDLFAEDRARADNDRSGLYRRVP